MKDKKTLSRQRIFKEQLTQQEVEVNSVAIKTATVAIKTATVAIEVERNIKKLMLRHINLCCDTIKKTRQKSLLQQKKIMLRQIKISK